MMNLEEAIVIHHHLIAEFGGSEGIRDQGLLEAAISRFQQTFDGQELYPTIEDKASAIIESFVGNHPFIDGNKRTGYVLMRLFLLKNGKDINATEDEKYEFVISIASGQLDFDAIKSWIERKIKSSL
jgi:death-on-curing protein